ncbi:MAG: hypothetical protein ACRESZ_07240 [Methylococcales bacterium]
MSDYRIFISQVRHSGRQIAGIQVPWMDLSLPSTLDTRFPAGMTNLTII